MQECRVCSPWILVILVAMADDVSDDLIQRQADGVAQFHRQLMELTVLLQRLIDFLKLGELVLDSDREVVFRRASQAPKPPGSRSVFDHHGGDVVRLRCPTGEVPDIFDNPLEDFFGRPMRMFLERRHQSLLRKLLEAPVGGLGDTVSVQNESASRLQHEPLALVLQIFDDTQCSASTLVQQVNLATR